MSDKSLDLHHARTRATSIYERGQRLRACIPTLLRGHPQIRDALDLLNQSEELINDLLESHTRERT